MREYDSKRIINSLLPAPMHPLIAEKCIAAGTHLVTASYTSPEMQKLDTKLVLPFDYYLLPVFIHFIARYNRAKSRNVLILNEIGLDPGIDHCSARQLIKRINDGGNAKGSASEIVSFTSFCGGLPAPEDSQVPLRYKFSWRPQGVLTAALNEAHCLLYTRVCSLFIRLYSICLT